MKEQEEFVGNNYMEQCYKHCSIFIKYFILIPFQIQIEVKRSLRQNLSADLSLDADIQSSSLL